MGPTDANSAGFVHGGVVMKLIDEVAGLAAVRHSRQRVVTAGADRMTFEQPIHVGQLVTLHASVNAAWNTSMEVGVRVEAENPRTGELLHTNSAYLTMVAVDDDGRPAPRAAAAGRDPRRAAPRGRGAAAPHQPAGRARADPRSARERGLMEPREEFLLLSFEVALQGVESGDGGPFGAVVVRGDDVLASAHNQVVATNDPTAHAEIGAIRAACATPRLLPARRLRPVLELRAVPDVPGRDLLGAAARGVLLRPRARTPPRPASTTPSSTTSSRCRRARARCPCAAWCTPRPRAPFVAWAAKPDRVEY